MLRRTIELAHEQRATSGTLVLDAIEDTDEVIVELGDWSESEDPSERELVLVLHGVPADLDPARLIDSDGHPLWSPGPNGPVAELIHERDPDGRANPASLFELPDRTWLVVSDAARARARNAFLRPRGTPPPSFAPDSLLSIRVDGPSLASHVPLLQSSGPLSGIGRDLRSVTLDLLTPVAAPGAPSEHEVRRDMRAILAYPTGRAAQDAGDALGPMLAVVGRLKPTGLAWLAGTAVQVSGTSVMLSQTVPTDLLAEALQAGRAGGARAP
jgi:hypothetical protein